MQLPLKQAASRSSDGVALRARNRLPSAISTRVPAPWFQDGNQKMENDQVQAGGRLKLWEASELNFGLSLTNVKNRSAFPQVQGESGGGGTSPGVGGGGGGGGPPTWPVRPCRRAACAARCSATRVPPRRRA